MMTERDLSLGSEHTIQYTEDIQNCTPEVYIILLTNVTAINSIKFFKREMNIHMFNFFSRH